MRQRLRWTVARCSSPRRKRTGFCVRWRTGLDGFPCRVDDVSHATGVASGLHTVRCWPTFVVRGTIATCLLCVTPLTPSPGVPSFFSRARPQPQQAKRYSGRRVAGSSRTVPHVARLAAPPAAAEAITRDKIHNKTAKTQQQKVMRAERGVKSHTQR